MYTPLSFKKKLPYDIVSLPDTYKYSIEILGNRKTKVNPFAITITAGFIPISNRIPLLLPAAGVFSG